METISPLLFVILTGSEQVERAPGSEASLLELQRGFLLFSSSAESWLDSSLLPSRTGQGLACGKANSGRQAASLGRGSPKAIALSMVHGIWGVRGDW